MKIVKYITNIIIALGVISSPTLLFANAEYKDSSCQQISGTLNIHWERLAGGTSCEGIEFTDGTLIDAADGSITMSGVSVSDGACIGTETYDLSVGDNPLTLTATETATPISMNGTRTDEQACFVGHWNDGNWDYLYHIAAAPLLVTTPEPQPATPIPTISTLGLAILAGLIGFIGYRRRIKLDAV